MKKIKLLLLGILFSTLLLNSCSEIPKKYGEPKQLIKSEKAKELNRNYIETRHRLVSGSIGKEDANAAWYSLEELENYINYIKNEGKSKGYKVDGIRFYLGAYPNDNSVEGNMTTIFLTPTGKRIETQKGSVLNLPSATLLTEENLDIEEISPMNFGTMGHPPKAIYPLN